MPSYQAQTRSRRAGSRRGFSSYPRSSSRRTNTRRGPRKDYINPAKFVKAAMPSVEREYIAENKFSDFDFHPTIHANLSTKGFETPSPIQDKTIALGLAGKDIIGIANTGTGKTAAFALPMINSIMKDRSKKVLVIAPTRELAQQIEQEFRSLAKNSGLSGALLIGGTNIGPQLRSLRSNPPVVIGTPGRIKDHIERSTIDLSRFNLVALDEVDRMLDMGFVHDVRSILGELSPDKQSFFFSATLDRKVGDLIREFSRDPVHVSVSNGDTTSNVEQNVVRHGLGSDKIQQLHDVLNSSEISKAIIFDETQRSVDRLCRELMSRGFKAESIHGGKAQGQRQRVLNRFKSDDISILVATDVAARGIDVQNISHVINYSTPQTYDDYIHRIGRAGRAGKIGYALTFIPA